MERRAFGFELIEAEGEDEGGAPIRGLAAPYDVLSEDLGGFRERIRPGAFAESIASRDVAAVWNHNSDHVLGRTSNGKLKLTEEARGLRFEVWPPETQAGRDAVISIRRGDVYQCSFLFDVVKQSWTQDGESRVRTLEQCELYEVSPVTFPAYPQTAVEARSVRDLIAQVDYVDFDGASPAELRQLMDALADRLPPDPAAGAAGLGDSSQARLLLLRRRLELEITN
jgi:HK97 family phage prohead protease